MRLRDEMALIGTGLFRRRSWLPLIFIPLIAVALAEQRAASVDAAHPRWEVLCLLVVALGITVRVLVAGYVPGGTSGRNTKAQKASALNTDGMYSIVRHPLYLGNFLIWAGVAMFPCKGWVLALAVLAFWLYYERIMLAEEEFLSSRFGSAFEEWAAQTPAVLPRLGAWRPPQLPFSVKAVLARENTTVASAVLMLFILELVDDAVRGKPFEIDPPWAALVAIELVAYLLLRWMKKRGLLAQEGR